MSEQQAEPGGPVAVVVGAGTPVARAVAADLAGHGYQVATDLDAGAALGPVRLVVHADVPEAATRPRPLMELDDEAWDESCEALVRSTLLTFQAAHRAMPDGGTIVLVSPTIALAGAVGLAAWSAAAEAQRVLVKVAARRWGQRGITVNVVSVPPELLCDHPDPGISQAGRTKAAAALGDAAATPAAAAGIVRMLAGDEARCLTGATLVADGGRVMVP
jgi:NAD(P)-dependent dehydrogenase (short-subunit alcohol dehydrogenase family)